MAAAPPRHDYSLSYSASRALSQTLAKAGSERRKHHRLRSSSENVSPSSATITLSFVWAVNFTGSYSTICFPSKCAATVFMPLKLPLSPDALKHSLLTFLALECRLAVYQGLGKGWLLAFPRFPPLLGCRVEPLLEAPVAKRVKAAHPKVPIVSTLARPSFFRSPCIGGQNLSLAPVPPCLQWVMPILKGIGNTLFCSRFVLRQTDLNPRQECQ